MMKTVKKNFEKKLVFGWVDAPSSKFLLDPIGITLESLPTFVVVDIASMKYHKTPYIKIGEEAAAVTYLQSVVDNKLPLFPIVEEKNKGKEEEKPKQENNNNNNNNGGQQNQETLEIIKSLKGEIESLRNAQRESLNNKPVEQTSPTTMLLLGIIIGFILAFVVFQQLQSKNSSANSGHGGNSGNSGKGNNTSAASADSKKRK